MYRPAVQTRIHALCIAREQLLLELDQLPLYLRIGNVH